MNNFKKIGLTVLEIVGCIGGAIIAKACTDELTNEYGPKVQSLLNGNKVDKKEDATQEEVQ